jgi:hypothetical protein
MLSICQSSYLNNVGHMIFFMVYNSFSHPVVHTQNTVKQHYLTQELLSGKCLHHTEVRPQHTQNLALQK